MDRPERRHDDRLREVIATFDEAMKNTLTQIVDNYDDLENTWKKAIARIEHRYRRLFWWVVVLTILLCTLVGLGFYFDDREDAQRDRDRKEAIVEACLARNRLSEANITFIRRVAPRYTGGAIRDFPLEPNCEAYAARILGP